MCVYVRVERDASTPDHRFLEATKSFSSSHLRSTSRSSVQVKVSSRKHLKYHQVLMSD